MRYSIVDGKIETRSLEVHITDHCNLRCVQCCSLSPWLPPRDVSLEELEKDLELAKRVLRPRYLKLTGGEPLLHPNLIECLRIAKASQISPIVSVSTNGLLLPEMPCEFWELIDQLTLSIYPGSGITGGEIGELEVLMHEYNFTLNVKEQHNFQTISPPGKNQESENAGVFSRCWLRHRCHMVRRGMLYLCTRPPHLDSYFEQNGSLAQKDGIRLHEGPELVEEILRYLKRDEPLVSCSYCCGADGEFIPHRQLQKGERVLGNT